MAVAEDETHKIEPGVSQTKTIVLAGKPGSGKSTVVQAVFGIKKQRLEEPPGIGNPPGTREFKRHKVSLGDITLNIVDTMGLSQKKSVRRKLERELSSEQADLLLLCISVAPGQRFEEDMPPIMKSLQNCYGTDIWRRCLPVLTFSNIAWDRYGTDYEYYKKRYKVYCDLYQQELRKLMPKIEAIVKTLFESPDPHSREGWPTIVAVPAGRKPGDQVLPDDYEKEWTEILKEEIISGIISTSQVDSPLASTGNSITSDNTTTSDSINSSDEEELGANLPYNEGEFIQQIEDISSKNETISRKLAHGMFVGPTGSGKTSLMDRLLDRKRKKFSPSTGVAEQVVVVNVDMDNPSTFHSVTATKDNIWKEKKYDESLNIQIKETVAKKQTVSLASPPVTNLPQEVDNSSMTKPDIKLESVSVPTQDSTLTKHAPPPEITHYVKLTIKKYGGYTKFKQFLKKTFSLYLRDTGGQVEFQEMLPLLIFGPSIFFFVFRLDLDFKSTFKEEYRKSTDQSLSCYTSSITTEEAFLQFLVSVYAMDTSGEVRVKTHKPLVFIVGTHRDQLGASADEKIAKLNQQLSSLIEEKGFSDLIVSADRDKGEVMFTVDNTSESDEDFKAIRSQVNHIIRSQPAFSIKYPLRYLLFSLELHTMKHNVLSFDVCKVMAAKYGIEEDQMLHLLQFLHLRIGVICYFNKDGVRHIVIKEPQVLFNAATSIIIKTFSSKALTIKEADDFEKRGILTVSVLETTIDIDFKDFLQLLTHLRITAPLSLPGDKQGYFFPSVLNHCQECSEETTHSKISPLCVKFNGEHCPKGLFGVLVTHLINPDHKEGATSTTTTFTLMRDKIFKNQVSFEVYSPGVQDEMVMKAHFPHLEIKFIPENSEDRDTSITEVCSNVCQILETSIQQSLQDLHYSKSRVAPEMCLKCDHCSELYVVKKEKKSFKMYCSKKQSTMRIPPQGEYWFSEGGLFLRTYDTASPVATTDKPHDEKNYEEQQQTQKAPTGYSVGQHPKNTKLRGVDELKETEILIDKSPQTFQWQGYGLKLHVPPQSLPSDVSSCTITIKASLSGQYQFPPDTHLVSPVFWLQCNPPCKFSKQLTLEIQHCAPRENSSSLRMVRAVCIQKDLPYTFKVLSGSTFSENSAYGLVSLSHFSGIAVTGPDERCYWSSVFYMGPPKNRDIHFTVTWDDELHLTIMNEEYERKKAIPGPQQPITFKETCISLRISDDGLDLGDQWRVYPKIPPKISKKVVDNHQTRSMRAVVPHCELVARWMKGDQQMQPLEHRVDILGASEETYFRISIYEDLVAEIPIITATTSPPTHVEVKRLLKSLTPEQMRDVGMELGLHYPNLKKMDDKSLLNEMINSWLKKDDIVHETSGTPSWESLAKALEEAGCTGVAENIKKDKL